MQKTFYSRLCLLIALLLGLGCTAYSYRDITVAGQLVSGSCSAWTNECYVYCRVDATGYKYTRLSKVCKESTTTQFICIDDNPEKLQLCERFCDYVKRDSLPSTSENCQ